MDFQPMSPEDMQRTMQFLLNQQAKFAADLEQLSGKTDRIADGLIGLTGMVGHVVEQVGTLATAQTRTNEHINALAGHLAGLDSRLNVVIDMFERHLREDHGQRPS